MYTDEEGGGGDVVPTTTTTSRPSTNNRRRHTRNCIIASLAAATITLICAPTHLQPFDIDFLQETVVQATSSVHKSLSLSSPSPTTTRTLDLHERVDVDDCRYMIAAVDKTCPKFLVVNAGIWNGLGDRFFSFVILLAIALERGFTPVYDDRLWGVNGVHGGYPWVEETFHFGDGLLNLSFVNDTYRPQIMDYMPTVNETGPLSPLFPDLECSTMYHFPNPWPFWETGRFFQTKNGTGIQPLQLLAPRLQCDLNQAAASSLPALALENLAASSSSSPSSSSLPPLAFENLEGEYNVVVHLRTGDFPWIPYSGDVFFRNLKTQLEEHILEGYDIHYYFIAESPGGRIPYNMGYLADLFNETTTKVTYLSELDVKSSLFQMIHADMLVLTGSGFPYLAATVSDKPVVVHGPNKAGDYEWFKKDEWVYTDGDGMIFKPQDLLEVRERVVAKHDRYKGKVLPFDRGG